MRPRSMLLIGSLCPIVAMACSRPQAALATTYPTKDTHVVVPAGRHDGRVARWWRRAQRH